MPLAKHEVCDNVDLPSIVQEFESFYAIKYGRQPKLTRRIKDAEDRHVIKLHLKDDKSNQLLSFPCEIIFTIYSASSGRNRKGSAGPRHTSFATAAASVPTVPSSHSASLSSASRAVLPKIGHNGFNARISSVKPCAYEH